MGRSSENGWIVSVLHNTAISYFDYIRIETIARCHIVVITLYVVIYCVCMWCICVGGFKELWIVARDTVHSLSMVCA